MLRRKIKQKRETRNDKVGEWLEILNRVVREGLTEKVFQFLWLCKK